MNGPFEFGRLLADDFVHLYGFHPVRLKLGKGLSGVNGVQLLGVPDQHKAGGADDLCDAQKIANLCGAG